jgi:glutathione S-transferase
MKLYQTYLSPFPTRVRLMLYAKGIDVEIVMPPGFHGDTTPKGEYEDVNPLGRVPTLVLDDGTALPESEVICEYLEDAYPDPPMHPANPVDKARMRLLSRLSDVYLVMAMVPLFSIMELPPKEWPKDKIRRALDEIAVALGYIEEFIGEEGYAVGRSLTQADGALIPMLLLVAEWLPIFRGPEPLLDAVPKTRKYWEAIASDPIAERLIDETREALLASMGGR